MRRPLPPALRDQVLADVSRGSRTYRELMAEAQREYAPRVHVVPAEKRALDGLYLYRRDRLAMRAARGADGRFMAKVAA